MNLSLMGTLLRLRCNGLDWLSEPIRRAVMSPLNVDWEHKRSKPSERGRWPDRSSLSMRVKNVGRESELLTWERWSESLGSRWFLQRSRDRCSFKTITPHLRLIESSGKLQNDFPLPHLSFYGCLHVICQCVTTFDSRIQIMRDGNGSVVGKQLADELFCRSRR